MEQLRANGQARAQREPRLPPEPAPPPDRLQREPAQQLQRELFCLIPNRHESRGIIIIKQMIMMTTQCLGYWDEILTIAMLRATTTKKNENSTDKEAVEKLKSEKMMDFVEPDEDDE
jgi:hypothetical protein